MMIPQVLKVAQFIFDFNVNRILKLRYYMNFLFHLLGLAQFIFNDCYNQKPEAGLRSETVPTCL